MIRHCNGYLVIESKSEETTEGGIIVAAKDRKGKCYKGVIVSGENNELNIGDTVYFDRGSTQELEHNLYAVKESGVMAKVYE